MRICVYIIFKFQFQRQKNTRKYSLYFTEKTPENAGLNQPNLQKICQIFTPGKAENFRQKILVKIL